MLLLQPAMSRPMMKCVQPARSKPGARCRLAVCTPAESLARKVLDVERADCVGKSARQQGRQQASTAATRKECNLSHVKLLTGEQTKVVLYDKIPYGLSHAAPVPAGSEAEARSSVACSAVAPLMTCQRHRRGCLHPKDGAMAVQTHSTCIPIQQSNEIPYCAEKAQHACEDEQLFFPSQIVCKHSMRP